LVGRHLQGKRTFFLTEVFARIVVGRLKQHTVEGVVGSADQYIFMKKGIL